jgi:hypothetical protein
MLGIFSFDSHKLQEADSLTSTNPLNNFDEVQWVDELFASRQSRIMSRNENFAVENHFIALLSNNFFHNSRTLDLLHLQI